MTKKITVELLQRYEACPRQVSRFKELFPDGVVPTLELCVKHARYFDWVWVGRLLPSSARHAFEADLEVAWGTFSTRCAAAKAAAKDAYNEAVTLRSSDHYNEAMKPAWAAYDEAKEVACTARDEAMATAWFNAWELTCHE